MKFTNLIITFALLIAAAPVWAGATFSNPVAVSDTYLRGSVSTADQSSDTSQYIGCYITSFDTGASVICMARNDQNVVKTCADDSPNQATLNAVAAISDAAYVFASISNGTCTRITVHNNSAFIE